MTVRELIEMLSRVEDQSAEVVIWDADGYERTIEDCQTISEDNENVLIINAL